LSLLNDCVEVFCGEGYAYSCAGHG
jgi:hypothetical protein